MSLQPATKFIRDYVGVVCGRTGKHELARSLQQALALLGAAEKVDKENALDLLINTFYIGCDDEQLAGKIAIKNQIRALLESLPDKE